jgi:tol-pal system protein YbgF
MFRIVTATAVIAAWSFSSPSAARAVEAQRDRDAIVAELRQIQAQLSQIQTSHAALKAAIDSLAVQTTDQRDALRKTLADSNVTLQRLEQDLSILSARVDETNGRIGDLQQEVGSMRQTQPLVIPPMETAENGADADADAVSGAPLPPPVVAAGPSITDIYNQARIDYTQGRYALAISGFKDVIASNARGDLADNAHYWIGECHFSQRGYERAIESFDTVVREYPDSNKRSDAYLKKAMSLESLTRRSEAMLMYELVIEQFPRTQHERIARGRLEDLIRTTPPQP